MSSQFLLIADARVLDARVLRAFQKVGDLCKEDLEWLSLRNSTRELCPIVVMVLMTKMVLLMLMLMIMKRG